LKLREQLNLLFAGGRDIVGDTHAMRHMVRTWSEVSAESIRGANGYETGTGSLVALAPK